MLGRRLVSAHRCCHVFPSTVLVIGPGKVRASRKTSARKCLHQRAASGAMTRKRLPVASVEGSGRQAMLVPGAVSEGKGGAFLRVARETAT